MTGTDSRLSIRGQPLLRIVLPPLIVLGVLAGLLMYLSEPTQERSARDRDLCPVNENEIAGTAMVLFDLNKPLDQEPTTLPGDLLHDIGLTLEANRELRVYSLTGSESSPRVLLARLCKPYSSADLQVEGAKDQRATSRDCNDLPAQLPEHVREAASRYCARRDAVRNRLNALANRSWPEPEQVTTAYLIEAFEDIKLDLLERVEPHALYVMSDMMQHAHWYSHLDTEWTDWNYAEFEELLESQPWLVNQRQLDGDLRVELFYLPRRGLTDQPRVQALHQEFWGEYFADTEIRFHNQATMRTYEARPVMNVLTEAEIAAQERLANEQLLRRIQQEQEALVREQRELEAVRRRQEEERRREAAERQRLEELEEERRQREQERLQQEQAAAERERQDTESLRQTQEGMPPAESDVEEPRPNQSRLAREDVVSDESPEGEPSTADEPPVEDTVPSFCPFTLASTGDDARPVYPRGGRMDYGDAEITVEYVIDENGETVDDEVIVDMDRSRADPMRYFRLFAKQARDTVVGWTFAFPDADDGSCLRRQKSETRFRFSYL